VAEHAFFDVKNFTEIIGGFNAKEKTCREEVNGMNGRIFTSLLVHFSLGILSWACRRILLCKQKKVN